MREFKNLKFQSVIPQDILQAASLLEKLGYEVVRNDFSVYDAASHNGVCAWDDGEITEGWLDDDNFVQVTLKDLKEMVEEMAGETNKCNNTLSNNNKFTIERLLGCEVSLYGEIGYICNTYNCYGGVCFLLIDGCVISSKPSYLKFFTEDGDELTFDEYVNMYYGELNEHI